MLFILDHFYNVSRSGTFQGETNRSQHWGSITFISLSHLSWTFPSFSRDGDLMSRVRYKPWCRVAPRDEIRLSGLPLE